MLKPTLDENIQTRINVHKTLYCLADIHNGVLAIVENKLVPVLIKLISTEDALVKIWIIQTLCKTLRLVRPRVTLSLYTRCFVE